MVSVGGGIAIAIVVLLLAAVIGWVVFTQLRARRLGLPPPTLTEYLPWKRSENVYGPPQPARGGVVGWFNDQLRKFKNRNDRTASGAYEQPLQTGAGRRGFGPLDPDEAWDARVGNEADSYGYYEERTTAGNTSYVGAGGAAGAPGGGSSYNMNVAYASDEEEQRGRRPSRTPGDSGRNPFDDDAQSSLRGVSPRPMEGGGAENRASIDTRRSAFREDV